MIPESTRAVSSDHGSGATYRAPNQIHHEIAELLSPPRRLRVSESAANIVQINLAGGYSGPWSAKETPYMVRPMDMLTSRQHESVILVGPARTGKTQGLLDCWLAHIVVNDPGDAMFVHMSQDMAADYSKRRVDRLHAESPDVRKHIRMGSQDDNTFLKRYRHGMMLSIAWPSTSQLAARDIKYVGLSDYDGMPQQIGREGTPYPHKSAPRPICPAA